MEHLLSLCRAEWVLPPFQANYRPAWRLLKESGGRREARVACGRVGLRRKTVALFIVQGRPARASLRLRITETLATLLWRRVSTSPENHPARCHSGPS